MFDNWIFIDMFWTYPISTYFGIAIVFGLAFMYLMDRQRLLGLVFFAIGMFPTLYLMAIIMQGMNNRDVVDDTYYGKLYCPICSEVAERDSNKFVCISCDKEFELVFKKCE